MGSEGPFPGRVVLTISRRPEHRRLSRPVLIISAVDSSGAAGMPVDIRAAESLGLPVRCAVTAVTVQGDEGVAGIDPVDGGMVRASIESALSDPPGISAVKVGVLADASVATAVADTLVEAEARNIPVVVDPVILSTSDHALIDDDGAGILATRILSLCTVATPNSQEVEALRPYLGSGSSNTGSVIRLILEKGARALLVTDGEGAGDVCNDVLYLPDGTTQQFTHGRAGGPTPRGTGCALSTSIAAHLGLGMDLGEAVSRSIDFVTDLIENSKMVGNQRLLFPKG